MLLPMNSGRLQRRKALAAILAAGVFPLLEVETPADEKDEAKKLIYVYVSGIT